jgi:16S rRNA (adenine1518-N6/adenine1519-N6)-dimethyltransferase
MRSDREIAALADPQRGQHFLVSAAKLSKLVAAAGITPADDVLEVGAGIGTVARALPKSRSLTVVELDQRLTGLPPPERAARDSAARRRAGDHPGDLL